MLNRSFRTLITAALVMGCTLANAQAVPVSLLDRLGPDTPLRACTTGDYRPFSFLRGDGSFEGLDIDMAQSLAKSVGSRLELVQTTWAHLLGDFTAGKCDIAIGGVSVTLDRQRHAAFSDPYLIDGKVPIALCTEVARFQTLEQINQPSVRVIVNPGGTNERFAKAHFAQAQLTVFADNVTVFDEIVNGHADVMVTDASETLLQHKLHPSLCSIHPQAPFQFGEKAFLLPRDDVAFDAYVDQWLRLLKATGEYDRMFDRWLK